MSDDTTCRERLIEQYFHADSQFWRDVYTQETLAGAMYRERRAGVLRYIDDLNLAAGSRVLDVGCGAGSTSIALARRGLFVDAVDAVPQMISLTERAIRENRMESQVRARTGDVHRLDFANDSFDCAVAVGVMEWMPLLNPPLAELHRIVRPGGWLISNVDNAQALHCHLDPRMSPFTAALKRFALRRAEDWGLVKKVARSSRCVPREFRRAIGQAGFVIQDIRTTGFGPFTFFGFRVMPERIGIQVHHTLQRLAHREDSWLRDAGDTYLVLARKPLDGLTEHRIVQV